MSTIALTPTLELPSFSGVALKAAARFWFAATLFGQWAFTYFIVAFYGPNPEAWTKNYFLLKGYVPGDTAGNLTFAAHALFGAIVSFGGAVQVIPWLRERAAFLHRWNGRLFLSTAIAISATGLYMVWVRHTSANVITALEISVNAVLIIAFCIVAWRTAVMRAFATHRRWALRAWLVTNGQWFFRIGIFAWIVINGRPVGITSGMGGPFPLVWGLGCYLLPLAMLELYLRAAHWSPRAKFVLAGALAALTVLMCIGIFGVAAIMWRPVLGRL